MTPEHKPEPFAVVTDGDTIQINSPKVIITDGDTFPENETPTLAAQYINSCEQIVAKTLEHGELAGRFALEATTDDWRELRRYINSISPNSPLYNQKVQLLGSVFELFAEIGGSV